MATEIDTTNLDRWLKLSPHSDYTQVMVWQGVKTRSPEEFERFAKTKLNIRVKFLTQYRTLKTSGRQASGGRNDILFAIHHKDINEFSIKRLTLEYPPSWFEDYYDHNKEIIPNLIKRKVKKQW